MKNQNKKILLFVIATIVTSFGIGYTMLKGTQATSTDVPPNEAFDDMNFYKCVVEQHNSDNETSYDYTTYSLSDEEMSAITYLHCGGGNKTDDEKIASIKGVEKLVKLRHFNVAGNKLTELDVSKNTNLISLELSYNQLTSLDISKNTSLVSLYVTSNQLTSLDVSKNVNLTTLSVGSYNSTGEFNNQLTYLDLINNKALIKLEASSNLLTSLDLSENTLLEELRINDNLLTKIDVSKNIALKKLYVSNNKLTELDVSKNTALTNLSINSNPYSETLYVYKGNSVNAGCNIKIVSQLGWNSPTWTSSNIDIAIVDANGKVTALQIGSVDIKETVDGEYLYEGYTTTSTVNAVEITSDKYLINEENSYIVIGTDNDVNAIKSNIKASDEDIYVDVDLDNSKLYVKYEDEILKEYKLVNIKFNSYKVIDKNIFVKEEVSYDDFTSDVTMSEGISYKIYNEDVEVTSGTIADDMIVKIHYNDVLVDEYTIIESYLEFDSNLNVDDSNSVIGNIEYGLTIDSILEKINTDGSISVLDKDDNVLEDTSGKLKTGDKFKVNLPSQVLMYSVSVMGDVNGDGDVTRDDVLLSSKHMIKGNLITGAEYLKAIDMDSNNVTNINDIVKMVKRVKVS